MSPIQIKSHLKLKIGHINTHVCHFSSLKNEKVINEIMCFHFISLKIRIHFCSFLHANGNQSLEQEAGDRRQKVQCTARSQSQHYELELGGTVYSKELEQPLGAIDKLNQQLNFQLVDCKQIKACSIGIYLVIPQESVV